MKIFALTLIILTSFLSNDAYALRCAPFNAQKLMDDENVEIVIGTPTHSWVIDPATGEEFKKNADKPKQKTLLGGNNSTAMLYNIDILKSWKPSIGKNQIITIEGRNVGSWKARRLIVSRRPTSYFMVLHKKPNSPRYTFGPCSQLMAYVPEHTWLIRLSEELGKRRALKNISSDKKKIVKPKNTNKPKK